MNARCTGCNAHLDFKATRGAKLADQWCRCMSRFEPMYFVRAGDQATHGWAVHRNYNNVEYLLMDKTYVLIIPTATP